MSLFWKAAAGVLITIILSQILGKQQKDLELVLTMAACSMVCILAVTYLEPVLEFLKELESLSELQGDMLGILLKSVGIGMIAELAGIICNDGGNNSLGQTLRLLGCSVILCLSLPVFRTVLELIRNILGAI